MSSPPIRAVCAEAPEFAAVVGLVETAPLDLLPELVGRLAQAQALAALRLASGARQEPTGRGEALLTVEEVAALLRVSEANVYSRAKTDLRASAVDVGPGQLRFDARRISRFVESRRRA